jgi:hypothetical protein
MIPIVSEIPFLAMFHKVSTTLIHCLDKVLVILFFSCNRRGLIQSLVSSTMYIIRLSNISIKANFKQRLSELILTNLLQYFESYYYIWGMTSHSLLLFISIVREYRINVLCSGQYSSQYKN